MDWLAAAPSRRGAAEGCGSFCHADWPLPVSQPSQPSPASPASQPILWGYLWGYLWALWHASSLQFTAARSPDDGRHVAGFVAPLLQASQSSPASPATPAHSVGLSVGPLACQFAAARPPDDGRRVVGFVARVVYSATYPAVTHLNLQGRSHLPPPRGGVTFS